MPIGLHPCPIATVFLVAVCLVNGIPGSTDFLSTGQGLGIAASGGRGSGNDAMVDGI